MSACVLDVRCLETRCQWYFIGMGNRTHWCCVKVGDPCVWSLVGFRFVGFGVVCHDFVCVGVWNWH